MLLTCLYCNKERPENQMIKGQFRALNNSFVVGHFCKGTKCLSNYQDKPGVRVPEPKKEDEDVNTLLRGSIPGREVYGFD